MFVGVGWGWYWHIFRGNRAAAGAQPAYLDTEHFLFFVFYNFYSKPMCTIDEYGKVKI